MNEPPRKRVDAWGQPADDSLEIHADAVRQLDELGALDEDDLTTWEADFVDSVTEAVDEGWISDRQAEKVRQIYDDRIRAGKRPRKGKRR